jgi:hypothetical protein
MTDEEGTESESWLSLVWRAPTNLVGLALAAMHPVGSVNTDPAGAVVSGEVHVYSSWVAVGLPSGARTIGDYVFFALPEDRVNQDPELISHERQHIEQHKILGPSYLPVHITSNALSFLMSVGVAASASNYDPMITYFTMKYNEEFWRERAVPGDGGAWRSAFSRYNIVETGPHTGQPWAEACF